jgi:4'-phosphopantetheinyl transferase
VSADVHVWWAGLERAPDLMDDAERARHAALRRDVDRQRLQVGSALLRLAAGRLLDRDPRAVLVDRTCPDCGGAHGKPHIVDGDGLEVSVSHSGDRVAVALTFGAELGVDVEQINPDLDAAALGPTVLHASEHASDLDTFLAYWTCKEAVLKATGDGLRVSLRSITIADPTNAPRLASWPARPHLVDRFTLYRLDAGPRHHAALAVIDPAVRTIHQRDASPLLELL